MFGFLFISLCQGIMFFHGKLIKVVFGNTFFILQQDINYSDTSRKNPRSNYFQCLDLPPNSLAAKFVNECSKDFMNPEKNRQNIFHDFPGQTSNWPQNCFKLLCEWDLHCVVSWSVQTCSESMPKLQTFTLLLLCKSLERGKEKENMHLESTNTLSNLKSRKYIILRKKKELHIYISWNFILHFIKCNLTKKNWRSVSHFYNLQ